MTSRVAALIGVFSLVAVISGAWVTSLQIATDRHDSSAPHIALGIAATLLIFTLGLYARRNWLVWIALVAASLDCVTPKLPILHAIVSPVVFSALIAAALIASPDWPNTPPPIELGGWKRLPALAYAIPFLVWIQIALGAGYRHHALSVLPHMAGAMIVTLAALIVCTVIVQQVGTHRGLRSTAIVLLCVLLVQVSLGIASFLMQLLDADKTLVFAISTTAHLTVGTLLLAASVALALQMERSIRKTSTTNVVAV